MLAPALAQKARDAASCHVRMQLVSVHAAPGFDGGPCEIQTRVDRGFRSSAPVSVGDAIALRVHCYVPPDGSPTGPAWLDYSKLQSGVLLEAFLNRTSTGAFEVALFQIAFSGEVGEQPDAGLWSSPAATESGGWIGRAMRRLVSLLGGT